MPRNGGLLATGTRVTGTVLTVEDGQKASQRRIQARYPVQDGRELTLWALIPDGAHPAVGDQVPVVYDPADPSRAVVDGYDTWTTFATEAGATG
ncbi:MULTISPECIES: DUF3592 domain-containing protein [Arthrobacter]|uniref:DUF3592 domain-containing protein n=2 Tax=Arthrobacter TaxID=1663 RepID=A0ABU9KMM0_9MICC|nr:DUF3592 domain-containing protein [Arthrobacter sp. YJM1]MDP5226979.1 DUF3592 domain-containing protein [Arthrobacter sp. YJM1]